MKDIEHIINEGVALRDKTTFQLGGEARYYARPSEYRQVAALLEWARRGDVPVFILGKGSNLLVSDYGFSGLVLHMSEPEPGAATMQWNNARVTVDAALPLNELVRTVADRGFRGMEELAGIPGTVGGAVIMNAGAFSQCIADTLQGVTCCLRSSGESISVNACDLALGYRTSSLRHTGDIVLSATFMFSGTEVPDKLNHRRREILQRRKVKQPLDFPNCGSVFKRPPGNYAGTLIEQCGLKGINVGGAAVSRKHANFIVNTGGAMARDVRRLIIKVQKRVFEQSGILLEPEVIFVGTFDDELVSPQGKLQ